MFFSYLKKAQLLYISSSLLHLTGHILFCIYCMNYQANIVWQKIPLDIAQYRAIIGSIIVLFIVRFFSRDTLSGKHFCLILPNYWGILCSMTTMFFGENNPENQRLLTHINTSLILPTFWTLYVRLLSVFVGRILFRDRHFWYILFG